MKKLILFLGFLVLAGATAAHLDAGFDQVTGPYLVDVGWAPKTPVAGQSASIAINVVNATTQKPVEVSKVFVRVEKGETVFFAANLALANGSSAFSYAFAEAGNWTVRVAVENHAIWVPIGVLDAGPETGVLFGALLVALALVCAYLMFRKKV